MALRTLVLTLALALVATVTFASPAGEEEAPATAMEKEMVLDPTTGEMVERPEYGGTLTFAAEGHPDHTDTFLTHTPWTIMDNVVEKLVVYDWGIDRDVWDLRSNLVPLADEKLGHTGQLAENWTMPDAKTIVFNIRQGVHFQDKPPVNGRELTAKDVVYNYHRLFGMGEFADAGPSPPTNFVKAAPIESVTATDEWTVVMKLSETSLRPQYDVLVDCLGYIYALEIIEEHGNAEDWRTLVGTGSYLLTDWVEGSSLTYEKNPNYWGYDEKYPENRLPYLDELKALIMPEDATKMAALRSGKLDYIGLAGASQLFSADLAVELQRTNPDLQFWPFSSRSSHSTFLDVTEPPFDDLRVRQALHMALDFEAINDTWFKGFADWKPQGPIGQGVVGYFVPFDEWPEDIKKYYTYDPAGAEALLDAAGYPRGGDGIRFTTTLTQAARFELGYKELVAGYWAAIGINVEINSVDNTEWVNLLREGTGDMWDSWALGEDTPPAIQLAYYRTDFALNGASGHDPAFDALHDALKAASTIEEEIRLAREADQYVMRNHWIIWGPRGPQFTVNQPWLKGYNGEGYLGACGGKTLFSRLWNDQDLKAEMGF